MMALRAALFLRGCGEGALGGLRSLNLCARGQHRLGVVWLQELSLGFLHLRLLTRLWKGVYSSVPARLPSLPLGYPDPELQAALTTRPSAGRPKGPGASKAASGGSCGMGTGPGIPFRERRQPD